jgi:hypothetical protein
MSRQASPKTAFIRKLLDESNGEITHADARPLLKKEGFDIAKEGGDDFEKESNYFNVTKYNWSKLPKEPQRWRPTADRPPEHEGSHGGQEQAAQASPGARCGSQTASSAASSVCDGG